MNDNDSNRTPPAPELSSAYFRGVTRLAPSPTGALHLGNARTFLINWALAKQHGWVVRFRMDDLDGPRIKPESVRQAIDTLAWLGMDWQEPILYQAADLNPYHDALMKLYNKGVIYLSFHSRKDIEQALSAPHADDHELRFPLELRPPADQRPPHGPRPDLADPGGDALTQIADGSWRLMAPDEDIAFDDGVLGPQRVNVQRTVGDFIVARRSRLPAYQLAVVVDDARQGVTDIVRGDDLLTSTARQLLLYRLLELEPPRRHWHLPLVLGEDGRRLAKRHGDTRLHTYQAEHHVDPQRIIGLIASWSGVGNPCKPEPMSASQFAQRFDIAALPHEPVTFTSEHHQWLLAS